MAGKSRPAVRLRVLRTQRLTPHMIRIVAGGPGLADFEPNGFADAYVKMLFPQEGVEYPQPFDMGVIRAEMPREQWPVMRTYTVRYYDANAGELALDFVHHGDQGLGGPWAAAARPGDELLLAGPGGAYAPGEEADWHLLAGDESALPAIAVALEAMPAGVPVRVFVEVADPAEEQPLVTKGDAQIQWLHRAAGHDLVSAVRALDFPGARCRHSSTVRPERSRSCAGCCSTSAAWPGRCSRSPATGAGAGPTRSGGRKRRRSAPRRRLAAESAPGAGHGRRRPSPGPRDHGVTGCAGR